MTGAINSRPESPATDRHRRIVRCVATFVFLLDAGFAAAADIETLAGTSASLGESSHSYVALGVEHPLADR